MVFEVRKKININCENKIPTQPQSVDGSTVTHMFLYVNTNLQNKAAVNTPSLTKAAPLWANQSQVNKCCSTPIRPIKCKCKYTEQNKAKHYSHRFGENLFGCDILSDTSSQKYVVAFPSGQTG